MKKTLAIIALLLLPLTSSAVFIVDQGGTGSTTLSGILKGNGKSMVQTAIGGTDYVVPSALSSYLSLSSWYATTTDGLDEGLTNLYFTNPRVQTYLDTLSKGYFWSTTSADHWYTLQNKASTTLLGDANIWSTLQDFSAGITTSDVNTNSFTSHDFANTFFEFTNVGASLNLPSTSNYLTLKNSTDAGSVNLRMENLTGAHDIYFPDQGGTFAMLSDITNASSTIYGDSGTFSGLNQFAKLTFTNATGTGATTTNFAITSVTNALHLANASGGVTAYTGASCTNQFIRSLNASGASTCATVANTDLSNSAITINGTSVSLGGSITVASTTLLANNNTWGGTNTFTNAPIFSSLTGVLKGNGASALTVASNGTDFTLTTAQTCSAGSFISALTASGGSTCTAGGTASSTLLGDSNLFSGNNIFNSITRSTSTQATSTNFFSTYVVGTNGTITNLIATNSTTTNATSTTGYFSSTLSGLQSGFTGRISPLKRLSYITATSTAWTATTSGAYLPPIIAPFAGTIQTAQCSTDAGTLNVDVYHTTTHLTLFNASTTVGTITFSSNNTVTNGEKMYISAGTPASTPTVLSCTLSLTENL